MALLKHVTRIAAQPMTRSAQISYGDAVGDFFGIFVWDFFVTLTYRLPRSLDGVLRDFKEVFIRRCAYHANRPLYWALVVEATHAGHLHIHALLAGTGSATKEQLKRAWSRGVTSVDRYDPARGAARYMAKNIEHDARTFWDISTRRPPIRRATSQTQTISINPRRRP